MSRWVAILEGVIEHIRVPIKRRHIPRIGHQGVRAQWAPDKAPQAGIVPSRAVIVQAQSSFFTLAGGETVIAPG